MDDDRRHMRRALEIARRGVGCVHPNPLVGAVVVREGRSIGEGWHARFGEAHAEVRALEAAGAGARGSTLYVTLEPCAHHGKTPPCVDAIVAAGVRRVVAAMSDPNPRVDGEGIERLRRAGLDVAVGVEERAARALNAPFLQLHREGRALVTLKLAASLDGRIAGEGGDARWISSSAARREVHALRAEADAVLVGRGTAARDDPSLTVRDVEGRNPVRIIVDSQGGLPRSLAVFSDEVARTVHATLVGKPAASAEHWELPPDTAGHVSLLALFERAAREGLLHVLVEGGAAIATSLVRERLVDVLRLYTAPSILGAGGTLAWAQDLGPARIERAPKLRVVGAYMIGDDVATTAIAPSHPAYADLDPAESEPVGAG